MILGHLFIPPLRPKVPRKSRRNTKKGDHNKKPEEAIHDAEVAVKSAPGYIMMNSNVQVKLDKLSELEVKCLDGWMDPSGLKLSMERLPNSVDRASACIFLGCLD